MGEGEEEEERENDGHFNGGFSHTSSMFLSLLLVLVESKMFEEREVRDGRFRGRRERIW